MTEDVLWDILDHRIVSDLVDGDGAERVLGALMSDSPAPEERARTMCELAVAGNILKLHKETQAFHAWAERHGLRRLVNALVELERVVTLPARGQAILQAQALTRHIERTLGDDIAAFKRAVTAD